MSFSEEARNPAYQRWGENESKAYIGFFLATCLAFGIFSQIELNWLWLAVIPLGMLVASIVGGFFSILGKYSEYKRVPVLPSLLRLAGMVSVIALTWMSLKNIGS